MNRLCTATVFACALWLQPVSAQEESEQKPQRGEAARQMRENWERALANSSLTPDEKAAFRRDLESVRSAARARRAGEAVNREGARAAAERIREVMQSDKIRPEDREALRAQWQDAARKGGRGGGRRPGGARFY